jgi:hypothetical protein
VTTKSTSDDERDPNGKKIRGRPIHIIKKRPERSAAVTRFFQILDAKRKEDARRDPDTRWKERIRQEPPTTHSAETTFTTVPPNMPVDYFDPQYFNSLQPRLRAKAASFQVALLPNVEMSFTGCDDERLSDAAFNKKYSDDVFARYNLVDDVDFLAPEDSDSYLDALGDDDDDMYE